MISNCGGASRSTRSARAAYRDVRTNLFPPAASAATRSRKTDRRPGKLSKVRSSRNSSSRNVAGASPGARDVEKKLNMASKAARALDSARAAAWPAWSAKGDVSRID